MRTIKWIPLLLLLVLSPLVAVEPTGITAQLGEVKVCVDPDWPPFETLDKEGNHHGIGADLLRLVGERAGVTFSIVKTTDWVASLAASQAGECQVVSLLNRTPERDAWLIFTDPIFTDPNVFITRVEHNFIADAASLSDATIVFPKGTSMEEKFRGLYPNLTVVNSES
ncbi:MAG: transporter substrate-binding domain-containing protein, partial [Gammaproteobacteria bacterium]|nr:transporter substrate-binding domain-containing protein [Gammaproteobacteria bacterium]